MQLIFIYNSDSGLFNTLSDIGHKLFSPDSYACSLCAITHGVFKEKAQWREFVNELEVDCTFMHRDQFIEHYPNQLEQFPAVLIKQGEQWSLCLSAQELKQCKTVSELRTNILHCINHAKQPSD